MSQIIKHKRSAVAGKVPLVTDLELGELATNTTDGKLHFRRADDTIQGIVTTNSLTSGSIRISGSVEITGSLDVSSDIELGNNLTVGNNLNVVGSLTSGTQVISGSLTISGSLIVLGDTIEAQITELYIEDKKITLASGSVNGTTADGAGIEIDRGSDVNVSMSFNNTSDVWDFSRGLNVAGGATFAGAVKYKVNSRVFELASDLFVFGRVQTHRLRAE